MQSFFISGNQWFEESKEPVLLLGEQGLLYYNTAAERLFQDGGIPLKDGGELPEVLDFVSRGESAAGEVKVAGLRWQVAVRGIEAGRLIQLRPVQQAPVFSNDRLPVLVERLRTPLSALLSSAELISRAAADQKDAKSARYLAVLHQSYHRLLRLINHLDYVRRLVGEEQTDFSPVVLDLAGLFREVGRQADSLAPLAGRSVTWQDNAGSLLIQGDSAMLMQLLYNLIANGWRAGGTVCLQLDRRGDRGVITVSDSGGGMRPGVLYDAFDPCAGSDDLAGALDGLGLGIPICQHIARLHGGTMVLEDRTGQGVTATVSLPVCTVAGKVEVHSPQSRYDATGGFSPLLIELSDVLPYEVFLPDHLEP